MVQVGRAKQPGDGQPRNKKTKEKKKKCVLKRILKKYTLQDNELLGGLSGAGPAGGRSKITSVLSVARQGTNSRGK